MDILETLKYLLLGFIQGITEPLPISSSGHVLLFNHIFNTESNDLLLPIILNTGSLVAIIIWYYKDLLDIVMSSFKFLIKKEKHHKESFSYLLNVGIGTLPILFIGFILSTYISEFENRISSIFVVSSAFLITSISLFIIHKINLKDSEITYKKGLLIGIFQVFSLIPGISRSGSTMVGGMVQKISFKESMKFSFFMYIPISLAVIAKQLFSLTALEQNIPVFNYLIGFLAAIASTLLGLYFLFNIVSQKNLKYFAWYCLVISVISFGSALL
jgi:undecaprenyl-diphosphatase